MTSSQLPQSSVVIHLQHTRELGGEDVAALIKRRMPDADVRAELDERGAVVGYLLTLWFPDEARAVDATFALRDWFAEQDWPVEFQT